MYAGKIVGQYRLTDRLGSGNFGEVWKAENYTTGELVAVKFFDSYNSDGYQDYINEVRAYEILSAQPSCDPYIVCMYEHGKVNSRYLAIIQELMSGDLTAFTGWDDPIKYRITNPLSILLLMYQCAEGLRHIHESGMVHSDIKPPNILYSVPLGTDRSDRYFNNPQNMRDNVCIKFGDPGFACTLPSEKDKRHEVRIGRNIQPSRKCLLTPPRTKVPNLVNAQNCKIAGTAEYMSPGYLQAARNKRLSPNQKAAGITFTQANDIWGLGLVFRSIIDGVESIKFLSYVQRQRDISPVNFNSGNPGLDRDINYVINNMMVLYDFRARKSAADIVEYLNNAIIKAVRPPRKTIIPPRPSVPGFPGDYQPSPPVIKRLPRIRPPTRSVNTYNRYKLAPPSVAIAEPYNRYKPAPIQRRLPSKSRLVSDIEVIDIPISDTDEFASTAVPEEPITSSIPEEGPMDPGIYTYVPEEPITSSIPEEGPMDPGIYTYVPEEPITSSIPEEGPMDPGIYTYVPEEPITSSIPEEGPMDPGIYTYVPEDPYIPPEEYEEMQVEEPYVPPEEYEEMQVEDPYVPYFLPEEYEEMQVEKMYVYVIEQNKRLIFDYNPMLPIDQLRADIEDNTGIPASEQRLVLQSSIETPGPVLLMDGTLEEYGFGLGDSILVL